MRLTFTHTKEDNMSFGFVIFLLISCVFTILTNATYLESNKKRNDFSGYGWHCGLIGGEVVLFAFLIGELIKILSN